jgi:uncharacterized protein (TIGR02466 family)
MKLQPLSTTPIWESVLPNFAKHQLVFIETLNILREQEPSGIQVSNITGYHSTSTLQNYEELRPLFDYIGAMANQACHDLNFVDCEVYVTTAWSNFNDNRSCMNVDHVHGETFSGCFYLQIPPDSGKLVIQNEGINRMWQGCGLTKEKNAYTVESIHLKPTEGQILLWPSYIPHSVTTNCHDLERISIAFNIIAVPKDRGVHNKQPVDNNKSIGLRKFNRK